MVDRPVGRGAVRDVGIPVVIIVRIHAIRDLVPIGVREAFVGLPVAVVVRSIAALEGLVRDRRIQRLAVRQVRIPVVVVVAVDTVGRPVLVRVREALVDLPVAVVVQAVAFLFRGKVHRRVLGLAVVRVGGPVAVVVVVASVAQPVLVEIALAGVRFQRTVVVGVDHAVVVVVVVAGVAAGVAVVVQLLGIRHEGADVQGVQHPVLVVIRIDAVGQQILVQVREALVDLSVAVVVRTVTGLQHLGGDRLVQRLAVGGVRIAVVVVVRVHAVGQRVAVAVDEVLVGQVVAVVVHAVAELLGAGMDRGVQRRAVGPVRVAIVVGVGLDAVEDAVLVEIGEPLVHQRIAVVVQAVAQLRRRVVDQRVQGGAVADVGVPVAVVVRIDAVGQLVGVGVREALVEQPVAIVVQAVTGLHARLRDQRVRRRTVGGVGVPVAVQILVTDVPLAVIVGIRLVGIEVFRAAIRHVRHAVAVGILVAGVALAVGVRVLLAEVAHERAVVRSVRNRVVIVVGIDAICEVVLIGVGEPQVYVPVAVVVDAVTLLGARHAGVAHQAALAGAGLDAQTLAVNVLHGAWPGLEDLVHLTVAVVVQAVARFRRRDGGGAPDPAFRTITGLEAFTGAELILQLAGACGLVELGGADAALGDRPALLGSHAVRGGAAGVSIRTVGVVAAVLGAVGVPGGAHGRAPVELAAALRVVAARIAQRHLPPDADEQGIRLGLGDALAEPPRRAVVQTELRAHVLVAGTLDAEAGLALVVVHAGLVEAGGAVDVRAAAVLGYRLGLTRIKRVR